VGKPIVRGEAGLDAPNQQNETVLGLQRDTTGVWLHNYLWSTLHSGGLYELYWWNSHIWNGSVDHRGRYKSFANFVRDIPLNKGGYVDWAEASAIPDSELSDRRIPPRRRCICGYRTGNTHGRTSSTV
jgi:hypothetical protein